MEAILTARQESHCLEKSRIRSCRTPVDAISPRDTYIRTRVETTTRKDVDRFILGLPSHLGVRVGW